MSNSAAKNETLISLVQSAKADIISSVTENYGYPMIVVAKEHVHELCAWLKEEAHFIYLTDVFGTDRFTSKDRFEVIYNIFSLRTQTRVFVKTFCSEEDPTVDTVTDLWSSANWHEREVFDMFGITFNNHPDMRRIYMPEDFEYYPLRKEFPLIGIPGSIELPNTTPDTE